jgi:hypothetical protein
MLLNNSVVEQSPLLFTTPLHLNKNNIMNSRIFTFAIGILMAGTLLSSCESAAQKEADANDEVRDAQEDLRDAQQEARLAAQNNATAEEWDVFKNETDLIIIKNENRVAELKVQLKKPGKDLDEVYVKRIDVLEQKNKDLKVRMNTYESNPSDWASFKREFNHDMDELGKALNAFTVDNQK